MRLRVSVAEPPIARSDALVDAKVGLHGAISGLHDGYLGLEDAYLTDADAYLKVQDAILTEVDSLAMVVAARDEIPSLRLR
ncbi:MAG: hypothetical protein IT226_00060 [Flavobacteriales bacterium]|nr:hypothetical protein [Flavobacteriales bacterium]